MWTYLYRNFTAWRTRWVFFMAMYFASPALTMYGLNLTFGETLNFENYAHYIVTGFMAYSALLSALYGASYGTFEKIEFQGTYKAILATPLCLHNLILVDVVWNTLRSLLVGTLVGVSASLILGIFTLQNTFLAIPLIFIGALAGSCFGIATVSICKKYDDLVIFEAGIAIFFIFSGIFTFIDKFPQTIQLIVKFFPLFHAVEAVRNPSESLPHLLILLGMSTLCFLFAHHKLKARLLT